jgi:hypothetical protein
VTRQQPPTAPSVLTSLLATVEIVAFGVAAHTWAGGSVPGLPWLFATVGLVALATYAVVLRRSSMAATFAALLAGQVGLHFLLGAMAPPSGHAGHHGDAALSWQMALAHIASAVVTLLIWQVRGRLILRVLGWAQARALVHTPRRHLVPASRAVGAHALILLTAPRRGPPMGIAPA